jgi:cell division transport system permease protein
MMRLFLPRGSHARIGIASGGREYDLPFNDDRANRFLILLIALMTFMALLATAAGIVLSGMADRWTAGLADHITIEIPTMDANGIALTADLQTQRLDSIQSMLTADIAVAGVEIQKPEDVSKLVEPWLGTGGTVLGQVTLPALMTINLTDSDPKVLARLKKSLATVVPDARLETHQSWLNDVLRLTSTLSFAAYLIGFMTAITTISAVAGAVRARMAAHHEQLEILHLIGASDEYITRQFQKHALQLSFLGSSLGFGAAMLCFAMIDHLSGSVDMGLIPNMVLSGSALLKLLLVPIFGCVITVFTTRLSVLQCLKEMP